jgi:hypothetical protein
MIIVEEKDRKLIRRLDKEPFGGWLAKKLMK